MLIVSEFREKVMLPYFNDPFQLSQHNFRTCSITTKRFGSILVRGPCRLDYLVAIEQCRAEDVTSLNILVVEILLWGRLPQISHL